ncbi:Nn.00g097220.m01.CDS01 [Neocucurbitaria sp. VM-36]
MDPRTPQKSQSNSDKSTNYKNRAANNTFSPSARAGQTPGSSPAAGGPPPQQQSMTPPMGHRSMPPGDAQSSPHDQFSSYYGQAYSSQPSTGYYRVPPQVPHPAYPLPYGIPPDAQSCDDRFHQSAPPQQVAPFPYSPEAQAPTPAAPPSNTPFVLNKAATTFEPGKKKHPDFLRKHLEAEGRLEPGKDRPKPDIYRKGPKGDQLRREKKQQELLDKAERDEKNEEQDDDESRK